MPRSAKSPEVGAVSAAKRNSKAEYVHLMTWLSDADHRNIITGAAGSAQNNGSMNSGKLVVSKSQGHVISPFLLFSSNTDIGQVDHVGKVSFGATGLDF